MLQVEQLVPERLAIFKACSAIVNASATSKAVSYAVGYAGALQNMLRRDEPDNAIHMQCLYVLNNIQHWRGDVAKSARAALKAFVEAK